MATVDALTVVPDDGTLTFTWALPSGYWGALVKWRPSGTQQWAITLAVNACTLAGLQGVPYDYQVIALAGDAATGGATPGGAPAPLTPPLIT